MCDVAGGEADTTLDQTGPGIGGGRLMVVDVWSLDDQQRDMSENVLSTSPRFAVISKADGTGVCLSGMGLNTAATQRLRHVGTVHVCTVQCRWSVRKIKVPYQFLSNELL